MSVRQRRSPVWQISKDELIDLLERSVTFTQVLAFFGLRNVGSNFQTLVNRLKEEHIDYAKFKNNRAKVNLFKKRRLDADVFVENSSFSRHTLKKRIIKKGLIPYECKICRGKAIWNNKPLFLVLDHINGIANDNRLGNLRFLCPNCNSQTETFAGRNKKQLTNLIGRDTM
jgi:hypothetical protein